MSSIVLYLWYSAYPNHIQAAWSWHCLCPALPVEPNQVVGICRAYGGGRSGKPNDANDSHSGGGYQACPAGPELANSVLAKWSMEGYCKPFWSPPASVATEYCRKKSVPIDRPPRFFECAGHATVLSMRLRFCHTFL